MVIVRSMPLRKADGPLSVQLPSTAEDRPSWLGVGAIAVVGFVVGIAWPRLAGVRLGPSVPDGPAASASAVAPAAPAASQGAPAVPVALAAPASSPAPASAAVGSSGGVRINVAHGVVFSCKTAGGEVLKGSDCGAPTGLDGLVLPRLRKLADCPEAASTSGKLHLVVRADFARDAVAIDLSRDKGVSTAEPLLVCAKSAMASASLEGIAHDNPRYNVAYSVTFSAPSGPSAPAPSPSFSPPSASAPTAAGDGTAQVEWEVAIVRDAPKTTGKMLARLPRGTPLRLGPSKDGWYPVKYGDGFGSDGWVYRGAIGK
jgi:SH3 domain-containing protein